MPALYTTASSSGVINGRLVRASARLRIHNPLKLKGTPDPRDYHFSITVFRTKKIDFIA